MEDVGCILWPCMLRQFGIFYVPFGIFVDHLVYFSSFGMLYQDKSGNPGYDHNVTQPEDSF
jgi:hypothetical protein